MNTEKLSLFPMGFLLLSNSITIVLAIIQDWSFIDVLSIYWWQGIIIGYYNWKRMKRLKYISTDNLLVNGRKVKPSVELRNSNARFFAIHYFGIQFAYLLLLGGMLGAMMDSLVPGEDITTSNMDPLFFVFCILMFIFNHRYSFLCKVKEDERHVLELGPLMFFPYARVLPMHFVIILAPIMSMGDGYALVFFLILKTIVDMVMHRVEASRAKKAPVVSQGDLKLGVESLPAQQ